MSLKVPTDVSGEVVPAKCDVRSEEDIKSLFTMAREKYGGVDVCVNNAGLAHAAPLLSGSTDDWRDMMEVGQQCVTVQYYTADQCDGAVRHDTGVDETDKGEKR